MTDATRFEAMETEQEYQIFLKTEYKNEQHTIEGKSWMMCRQYRMFYLR